jgi:glycosyltransferase involved in cell wall biosynthesis
MTYRLAVVASHVIQYQDPLFRRLAAHPEIDLTVLYCSQHGLNRTVDRDMGVNLQWNIDLLHGYRYRFVRNVSPFGMQTPQLNLMNPGLVTALRQGDYDAVIVMFGWGSVSSWLTFATAGTAGIPFMLYGDSSFPEEPRGLLGGIRKTFLEELFHRTGAFLISGALNAEYYRFYGADPRRFFQVPWAVDNERFMRGAELSAEKRKELRGRLGIGDDRVVILFSGKLVDRKDPLTLLRAFEQLNARQRASVVFMGDGVLKPVLEKYAQDRAIEQVVFPGFINQQEIPSMYGLADIFVLPSTYEPRGAVINEAMASGLPVVVSDRVGSIGDIVRPDDNALIFRAGDAAALSAALDRLMVDPDLRDRMGRRSREIISTWSYHEDVQGILEALKFVSSGRTE